MITLVLVLVLYYITSIILYYPYFILHNINYLKWWRTLDKNASLLILHQIGGSELTTHTCILSASSSVVDEEATESFRTWLRLLRLTDLLHLSSVRRLTLNTLLRFLSNTEKYIHLQLILPQLLYEKVFKYEKKLLICTFKW